MTVRAYFAHPAPLQAGKERPYTLADALTRVDIACRRPGKGVCRYETMWPQRVAKEGGPKPVGAQRRDKHRGHARTLPTVEPVEEGRLGRDLLISTSYIPWSQPWVRRQRFWVKVSEKKFSRSILLAICIRHAQRLQTKFSSETAFWRNGHSNRSS